MKEKKWEEKPHSPKYTIEIRCLDAVRCWYTHAHTLREMKYWECKRKRMIRSKYEEQMKWIRREKCF